MVVWGFVDETEQVVSAGMAGVVGTRRCRTVLVLAILPRPPVGLMQLNACVCCRLRAHWLSLELALRGWRKVTAALAATRQQQQQQEPLEAQPVSAGVEQQQPQVPLPQGSNSTADGSPDTEPGSEAEDRAGELGEEGSRVAVSLADFPVGHPWRPLLQRTSVLAPQGLRRLSGLRLGRAVKDLRELEGGFVVKDAER